LQPSGFFFVVLPSLKHQVAIGIRLVAFTAIGTLWRSLLSRRVSSSINPKFLPRSCGLYVFPKIE
jgi:hypothetical protein